MAFQSSGHHALYKSGGEIKSTGSISLQSSQGDSSVSGILDQLKVSELHVGNGNVLHVVASGGSSVANFSNAGLLTASAVTATGAVTGGSLTDGTASVSSGAVSGVTTLAMGGALSGVTTLAASGVVTLSNATAASAVGTAALTVAGGLGVSKDIWLGDDLVLDSDGSIIHFGDNQEVTLTHVHDAGLLLNSDHQLQFGDAGTYIFQPADGTLGLTSDGGIGLSVGGEGVVVKGTTPKLTIGDAGAEDTFLVFDGNAQDYRIGLDDGTDKLEIGVGAAHGSGTALTIDSSAVVTTGAGLVVTGDLTVNGTTTTVNSTVVSVDDPIFNLGGDTAPGSDDSKDRGITYQWHNGSAAKIGFFGYDDSAAKFTFIPDASISGEVISGSAGTIVAALEGNVTGNCSGSAATVTGAAQTSITSLGTLTALTVDDVAVNGKVITMTGSASDTVVMTAGTNGTFSLVTTDANADAANIQITADGTVDIDSAGILTLDSGAAINLEPAAGSVILLDGTISVDGGVVTGATSITSTAFVGGLTGNVTGNTSGSSGSCTGLAATATALASARTIGGVSFDGTANIDLPGVNSGGNQDTSGNASTATLASTVTVSANNSTDETVYPLFVDGATGAQGAETDTGLTYNPSSGLLTATTFSGAIASGATATTQNVGDNSTKIATTAYADASGGSLDSSYDGGRTITVDAGPLILDHSTTSGILSLQPGLAAETAAAIDITHTAVAYTGRPHGIKIDMSSASSLDNDAPVFGAWLMGKTNAGDANSVGLYIDDGWDQGLKCDAYAVFGGGIELGQPLWISRLTDGGENDSATDAPSDKDLVILRSDGLSKANAAALATSWVIGAYSDQGGSGDADAIATGKITLKKSRTNASGTAAYDTMTCGDKIYLAAAIANEYDSDVTPATGTVTNENCSTAGSVNFLVGICAVDSASSASSVKVYFQPQYLSTN